MGELATQMMKSYSQSHQDEFAWSMVGDKGTFLDIGCGGPTSNTRGLEELGWTGWLIDISREAFEPNRTATTILYDATQLTYGFLPDRVDYLSLDVDEATLDVLKALPLGRVRFKCITIEHDAYRFGDTLRGPQREILKSCGYRLFAADVSDKGLAYEDWHVCDDYNK